MNIPIGTATRRPIIGNANSKKQTRSSMRRLENFSSFRLSEMITSARTAKKENNWLKFQKLNKDNGNHRKNGNAIICPFNIIHKYAIRDNVLTFVECDI